MRLHIGEASSRRGGSRARSRAARRYRRIGSRRNSACPGKPSAYLLVSTEPCASRTARLTMFSDAISSISSRWRPSSSLIARRFRDRLSAERGGEEILLRCLCAVGYRHASFPALVPPPGQYSAGGYTAAGYHTSGAPQGLGIFQRITPLYLGIGWALPKNPAKLPSFWASATFCPKSPAPLGAQRGVGGWLNCCRCDGLR